ncbi:M20/M25/M40 family metallo-hydrolase [Myroides marinus]|uniref:M20/M25/M40 family metallo-hydrolase n=1 Tax=Myroides marinus TaxID=703342 RepID=UPI002575E20F|nr:M20/M25/M40 family metallo-hydrolase [Myroides marinus]MDM1361193.1 M20/M25/M40 family metallo-hydrolase [Myroides marinus]MDM1368213.1 M20/M25/M40 family metallo-hydrolase [Myroides marinus]MDM1375036.1 M20/M25/M40 family metallo-hydrolase [Myroides marinus]MDM1383952.1 M20/M25/M40 family metallo-hydrolase [Myroides marinus]MDM1404539.1 M20/M25/M40 family metallo-hydrolase [Myroides marinus]
MRFNTTITKTIANGVLGVALLSSTLSLAQKQDAIVDAIVKEGTTNSQLKNYAFELMDVIGPRLVGTPQMMQAHNWVKDQYASMGFESRNEEYGTWKAWERGTTQITMTSPRIKSLEGMQLAWSPASKKGGVDGEVVVLVDAKTKAEFEAWLPSVKGKYVLISMHQPTGRPDYQWQNFATEESYAKMKEEEATAEKAWATRIKNTGYTAKELPKVLEDAGAAGVVMSYWTGIMGANRIFGAETKKVPTIDIAVEDYGMLYRLAENGKKPRINVNAQSKDLGTAKTYNTIAELKGGEKADEYVILSAHLDSWDGGTGATDNGTGIITMMEAARILKAVLPNPKRTILIGNWGSEEQGLNGSRAFVADHPELHNKIQVVFNQDNGTGRVANISGQGFLNSYQYITDWLYAVPEKYKKEIKTSFPGSPSGGGSDHVSFVSKDIPGFMMSSLSWGYGNYTWHTNRDTADKIVYDDVQNNAILIAIMAYKASEEKELVSREKIVLPLDNKGERQEWPESKGPKRTSN